MAEYTETPEREKKLELVKRVIQYIENNCATDMSNKTIGERFHFNSSYLNRIFKENTGNTLHSFLIRYRMNLAMDLLCATNLSVGEIAGSVGFSDIPHFIKTFKKITGEAPAKYRNKGKGKSDDAKTLLPYTE